MMSSLMPSEKYSCAGSSLMFANGSTAIAGRAAHGRDVDRDMAKIEPHRLAIGDDPLTVRLVDERPQAGQAPPQGGTGIIRDSPEHGAEPVAAVRTRGHRQIGEQ